MKEDLKIDSLSKVEMALSLEDTLDLTLQDAELEDIKTVQQVLDLIESRSGSAMPSRVVVTGYGAITPLGCSVEALWKTWFPACGIDFISLLKQWISILKSRLK